VTPTGPPDRAGVVVAGHTGDTATARAGLDSPDPGVRASALGALERCGALDDATLIDRFTDPHPAVRRRAAELAAGRRGIDLAGLLADPDTAVVEMACWACGEHEDPTAVPTLAALATTHDDALVREAAVAALGAIGDDGGLPAILAACQDKPAVRRRAVLALAPFDGPDVDAALAAAARDKDWQVRQAAEDLS
jgi:HEAT repeat protein